MKEKVSIVLPKYKPNRKLLNNLRRYLKKHALGCEIVEIEGVDGLANAYNQGIKKAKGEIIITIHQDCLPLEKDSIKKLIKPFENPKVVMTFSWIKDCETNRKYSPLPPDGKFVAFRKKILEEVGLFDEKIFFTGGEDVDIWLKLKKKGEIIRVETEIAHFHPGYLGNKTLEKRRQNGSINGALFRIWGFKNPKVFKSLIACVVYPRSYGGYFFRAFFRGKQEYRRKE